MRRYRKSLYDWGKHPMQATPISHWLMMVIFFGVIFAIPVLWYLLGIKSYGTGDYWQP